MDAAAGVPAGAGGLTDQEGTMLAALEARRQLRLFLGVSAFLIACAVLVTAALRSALLRNDPTWHFPTSSLILYGAFFSLLLAVVFVPAYMVVQDTGWRIVTLVLEKSALDPPEADWFTLRSSLVAALELDVGLAKTFAGAFAILTPIASAYLTSHFASSPETPDAGDEAKSEVR
jgi:hypothetical protein